MDVTDINNKKIDQEFNELKRAAENGPVFIPYGDQPTHVLITFKDYLKLQKSSENIVDLLAMPDAEKINFEPEKLLKKICKLESFD